MEDQDEILYYIEHSEDNKEVKLTVVAPNELTAEEYLLCLRTFIADAEGGKGHLFADDDYEVH